MGDNILRGLDILMTFMINPEEGQLLPLLPPERQADLIPSGLARFCGMQLANLESLEICNLSVFDTLSDLRPNVFFLNESQR